MGAQKAFPWAAGVSSKEDPLSPLLFNLVMEALSRLVSKASDCSLLKDCVVGPEAPPIPLL